MKNSPLVSFFAKQTLKITSFIYCAFLCTGAIAAEISMTDVNSPGCDNILGSRICITVSFTGEIKKGDEERLRAKIDKISTDFTKNLSSKTRVGEIYFDSSGGDLIEAMHLGRLIRNEMITTKVNDDSSCYSSCVIAFIGGVQRIPIGPIGIHSFYSKDFLGTTNFTNASEKYNEISSLVEQYLREIRIPISLLDEMKKIPHFNVEILKFEELKQYGVIGIDPVYAQMKDHK